METSAINKCIELARGCGGYQASTDARKELADLVRPREWKIGIPEKDGAYLVYVRFASISKITQGPFVDIYEKPSGWHLALDNDVVILAYMEIPEYRSVK